jgi:hypothetical protein
LVKGKPWDFSEVRYLTQLVDEGKSFDEIAKIMVKTDDAIRQKVFDLGLKVKVSLKEKKIDENKNRRIFFSSKLELPAELPSVETTLKILAAALKALDTPGLEKSDVLRLRGIIAGCKVYKELFADYVNYRGLEAELLEGRAKIAELRKKASSATPK